MNNEVVKHTLDIELRALVEDTSTLGTGAGTDQVGEETTTEARVDISGVTGVDGLVAARELGLVTTLGLSLLDGHSVGNGPLNVSMAPLGVEVARDHATGLVVGDRGCDSHGGESKNNGADGELHLECIKDCKSLRIIKKVDRVLEMFLEDG